jgi:pimeloyl-ACP methyl ester carboxylesterase
MAAIVSATPQRAPHPTRRRLLAAAGTALLASSPALQGCAWLDMHQRRLALRPTPGRPPDADSPERMRPGDERFLQPSTAAPDESVAFWWLPHPAPESPALLYLHGTLRNLYYNQPKIDALRDAGYAVLAVDYRGWGESTPIVPSEDTIVADARQAYAELARRQPSPRRRVLFGHSMGSAVAVTLASELHRGRDYAALVLESAFTSMPDVAGAAGFWGSIGAWITTLSFDSLSRIGRVDAPIVMMHGTDDDTVPIDLGRRLRDAAPPGVQWIEIPGGRHSNLHRVAAPTYQATMRALRTRLLAEA